MLLIIVHVACLITPGDKSLVIYLFIGKVHFEIYVQTLTF